MPLERFSAISPTTAAITAAATAAISSSSRNGTPEPFFSINATT